MKAKRFWDKVSVVDDQGYQIDLDERRLKTPNQKPFVLPSKPLAEAIAKEWESVEGEINPMTMPLTKMANTAIERIPATRADVQNHLLEYLENDLLIYRSAEPEALFERQKAWDDWVHWAKDYGIILVPTTTLFGGDNLAANREAAQKWLAGLDDFELGAFYEFVVLTGSFVLAMAVAEGKLEIGEAFDLSRLEEDFQSEIWGAVDVKLEERAHKRQEIEHAQNFIKLLREL